MLFWRLLRSNSVMKRMSERMLTLTKRRPATSLNWTLGPTAGISCRKIITSTSGAAGDERNASAVSDLQQQVKAAQSFNELQEGRRTTLSAVLEKVCPVVQDRGGMTSQQCAAVRGSKETKRI